jgi:hypothetical protein
MFYFRPGFEMTTDLRANSYFVSFVLAVVAAVFEPSPPPFAFAPKLRD